MKEEIITNRMRCVLKEIRRRLAVIDDYRSLPESEKIPLRVLSAEKMAYEEYLKGGNLNYWLSESIAKEHYCGAQGIKNAIEYINLTT